ncbi:MAG TPA: AI-2E family transporter [Candidatus Polarisedimenticolaceae bacterium]|nr:AI-2E family transporter [Candidatus Polarisedimenticolaceae bacterium]
MTLPASPPARPDAPDELVVTPGRRRRGSIAVQGLFVLSIIYTLYVASAFLLPVVLAILLTFLLRPLVAALARIWIPPAIGAAIVVLGTVGTLGYTVWQLAEPAVAWADRAPSSLRDVERKLRILKEPMQTVSRATEQVEKLTTVEPNTPTRQVEIKPTGLRDTLWEGTWGFLGATSIMLTLCYFLLASGDFFVEKAVNVLPRLQDKKLAVRLIREVESQVSLYLLTTTLINAGVGVATGLAAWWLGLPNPVLWGVVSWLLNYIPYLGALVNIGLLAVAGLITFDRLTPALLPAAAFLGINLLESNVVTPFVLGRRLELNPVMVFLGLTFWWWIWGIPGSLLAVPILGSAKLICDRIPRLSAVAALLGR